MKFSDLFGYILFSGAILSFFIWSMKNHKLKSENTLIKNQEDVIIQLAVEKNEDKYKDLDFLHGTIKRLQELKYGEFYFEYGATYHKSFFWYRKWDSIAKPLILEWDLLIRNVIAYDLTNNSQINNYLNSKISELYEEASSLHQAINLDAKKQLHRK